MADDYYGESKLRKILRPDDPKTQTIMTVILIVIIIAALYFVINQIMGPSARGMRDQHYYCNDCHKEFIDTVADQKARQEESTKKAAEQAAEFEKLRIKAEAENKTVQQYAEENNIEMPNMGYGPPGMMGMPGMPGSMGIECKLCGSHNTVQMLQCPNCKKYYVGPTYMWKDGMPINTEERKENICPHCKTDVDKFRQNQKKK